MNNFEQEIAAEPNYQYTLVTDQEVIDSLPNHQSPPKYNSEWLVTDYAQQYDGTPLTTEEAKQWLADNAPVTDTGT